MDTVEGRIYSFHRVTAIRATLFGLGVGGRRQPDRVSGRPRRRRVGEGVKMRSAMRGWMMRSLFGIAAYRVHQLVKPFGRIGG